MVELFIYLRLDPGITGNLAFTYPGISEDKILAPGILHPIFCGRGLAHETTSQRAHSISLVPRPRGTGLGTFQNTVAHSKPNQPDKFNLFE